MLFAAPDPDGKDVPAIGMLHASLRVINEDTRINTAEPAFSLEQEGQILAARLRFDVEESRQTLLIK
jgi:hypothetical protein